MMNKYVYELFKQAMAPIFAESKYPSFIDDETYKRNYGKISLIHDAVRKLEKELEVKNLT